MWLEVVVYGWRGYNPREIVGNEDFNTRVSSAVVVSSGNELHDWNKSKKNKKPSMELTERRRIRV